MMIEQTEEQTEQTQNALRRETNKNGKGTRTHSKVVNP